MIPRDFYKLSKDFGLTWRSASLLLAFNMTSILFEGMGLTMLLPIYEFVSAGSDLSRLTGDSEMWRYLILAYGKIGLDVTLTALLVTSFICILLRQCFVYIRLVYTRKVNEAAIWKARNRGFSWYLKARTSYQDKSSVGELVNDLTNDLKRAVDNAFGVVPLLGHLFLIIFYLGLMFTLSAALTATAVAMIVVSGLVIRGLVRRSEVHGKDLTFANQEMYAFLVQRLRLTRLIRLSGTEDAETAEMRELTARQRDHTVQLGILLARIEVVIEPFFVGLGFIFLYVGVQLLGLSLGSIGVFLLIALRLLPVVKELMRTRQGLISNIEVMRIVYRRFQAMRDEAEPDTGMKSFPDRACEIVLTGVRFCYAAESEETAERQTAALEDVCVTIPAGKMTALAGPSGAGKSTLIDLLPRLRTPDTGQILFDGVPIEEFSLSSLRRHIAYVPQSPQIFNVTVAQHIRYGKRDASDAEIRAAAREAGADEFIERLENGYDTQLGEETTRLSGGQKQRLDLARALVRQAPVLILDEPTSNLDAVSEELFWSAVQRIRERGDKTIVVIAHRLMTVQRADQIVVLQAGRVLETGRHEELTARGGWYAEAFSRQSLQAVAV